MKESHQKEPLLTPLDIRDCIAVAVCIIGVVYGFAIGSVFSMQGLGAQALVSYCVACLALLNGVWILRRPGAVFARWVLHGWTALFFCFFHIQVHPGGYLWGLMVPMVAPLLVGMKKSIAVSLSYLCLVVATSVLVPLFFPVEVVHMDGLLWMRYVAIYVMGGTVSTLYEYANQKDRGRIQRELDEKNETAIRVARQRQAIETLVLEPTVGAVSETAAIQRICATIAAAMHVARASVWNLVNDGDELVCSSLHEATQGEHSAGMRLQARDYPKYFHAIQKEKTVSAGDACRDPRTCELESYLQEYGITSLLDACIVINGQMKGVVCAEHTGPVRSWYPDELAFLSTMAAMVAQIYLELDRQRAERALYQSNKQLESAIQRAQELARKAEAANTAKTQFLANMSHEIRTPLNAILGFSQLLQRDATLSAEHGRHVETINRSGEHLLTLLNNILDLSKIEAGHLSIHLAHFDLQALLSNVANLFRMRAELKGVVLTVEGVDQMPRLVMADEQKLRQILVNLMGNAVKFTSSGTITLRTFCMPGTNNNWQLMFLIVDSGPGIRETEFERIFAAFEQSPDHDHVEGTGLGLAISRQLARFMGGDISVTSTLGKGSIFRLDIPVGKAEEDVVVMDAGSENVLRLTDACLPCRALIVDDNDDNRQFLMKTFESAGFCVLEADGGGAAVELAQQSQPDIILMDAHMPEVPGVEAIRRIRQQVADKQPVIIAVSADTIETHRKQLLSAGANAFLAKPFVIDELFDLLRQHAGIDYIYKDDDAAPTSATLSGERMLSPEDFAVLPDSVRDELCAAASSGSKDRLEELISELRPSHQELGAELLKRVQAYDYEGILRLVSQSP